MRRALILAAALLLAPLLARAQASAEAKLSQHVTDRTGTLSAQQVAALEAPLVALEQRKGAQVAILVIASTGAQSIEEYSLAVAEANRLGREQPDDGLLLLVAKDDRKARIEVGYGLEGAVTDAISSRIIREYLAPKFRQGDYYGGLSDASVVLVKLIDGEPLPAPMAGDEGVGGQAPPSLVVAIFIGLFVGLFAGATRLKPAFLRRAGAALFAGGLLYFMFALGLGVVVAAIVAFLVAGGGAGRFGSGNGSWGSFPGGGGGGGWSGGGGGWSGGGGSFGGGGASGGW